MAHCAQMSCHHCWGVGIVYTPQCPTKELWVEEANKIMDEKGTQFCQMKAFMATSGGTGPEHLSSLLGLSLGQAFNRHLLNIYFAPVIWVNRASEMILGGTPGFPFLEGSLPTGGCGSVHSSRIPGVASLWPPEPLPWGPSPPSHERGQSGLLCHMQ